MSRCLTAGGGGEHRVAEIGRRGQHRRGPEQRGGAEPGTGLVAHLATLDVTGDPLADQHRKGAVPAVEDAGQLVAVLLTHAGHRDGTETAGEPIAHAVHEHVGLAGGDPHSGREIGAGEVVAEAELHDELVPLVEPGGRGPHQLGQLDALDVGALGPGIDRGFHLSDPRPAEVGGPAAASTPAPPVDLVAQHGEEPCLEPVRLPQLTELARGDQEHLLDGIGGLVPVAEHGGRRVVQGGGIAVVDRAERGPVAAQVGGDQRAVGPVGRHVDPSSVPTWCHHQSATWYETTTWKRA